MNENPPAHEGQIYSDILAKHLSALHSARLVFTQSEPLGELCAVKSEHLSKRISMVIWFITSAKWIGLGKVIFQDGKVVFVGHGGTFDSDILSTQTQEPFNKVTKD